MKCNQWTLGLAALGAISLASVVQAEDAPKPSSLLTALPSTTLSGYVDTSMQWNIGTGNSHAPGYAFGGPSKADGFNLNVIDLNLEKDPDATDTWGAGYKVELWAGPDAAALATQSSGNVTDFAVKNAYVDLKAPIGTGLDMKVGVWDTIIGYEVADSPNNPNFSRSWAFTIEPTTHTGVLFGYTVNEMIALQAGIADTYGPAINGRAVAGGTGEQAEYYKTYLASVQLTAPTNWGWVAGSTLYGCVINGFNSGNNSGNAAGVDQTSLYFGATMNTPLKALKVGASYDYAGSKRQELTQFSTYANAFDLYATYQANDKLSFNTRVEYFDESQRQAVTTDTTAGSGGIAKEIFSFTETVEYDLWKNVMSRVEFRWDHALGGQTAFGGTGALVPGFGNVGTLENSVEIIGNIIYKF